MKIGWSKLRKWGSRQLWVGYLIGSNVSSIAKTQKQEGVGCGLKQCKILSILRLLLEDWSKDASTGVGK